MEKLNAKKKKKIHFIDLKEFHEISFYVSILKEKNQQDNILASISIYYRFKKIE